MGASPARAAHEAETGPMRLNKYLARAGVASRRKADELIAAGGVAVNGETVTEMGFSVDSTKDTVTVNGQPAALPSAAQHLYLLLHKPIETVTTASDPQGRTTVLDSLPKELQDRRPVPVGRLDYYSEGLLLLTTDGDLTHRLTHPSHHVDKVYEVTIRGKVPPAAISTMAGGMRLAEGETLAPVGVKTLKEQGGATTLELTLSQGVNRQIRRMCRDLNLTILRLSRVAQGPLTLGVLKPGCYRELTGEEIKRLKQAVSLA